MNESSEWFGILGMLPSDKLGRNDMNPCYLLLKNIMKTWGILITSPWYLYFNDLLELTLYLMA